MTKVDVYRNLKQKCFSIRSREKGNYGRVIGHAQTVAVRNATFIVQPAGREKVVRTGIKNVHAFVRGDLVTDMSPESAWHSCSDEEFSGFIYYNYRFCDSFIAYNKNNKRDYLARSAKLVIIGGKKVISAKGIEVEDK